MEDNPSQEHQSSISPAATGCSKNIEPTEVAPKLLVSGQPLESQSSNNCSNVDIVPEPVDAHLPQGDEDVNIADFVQESSSGMPAENSSIDFLPCSMDLQEKLPKVDMALQPDDAQGDEDVNIADFVVEGSSGSPPEKLSCSTDLQDKLPRVDMALQPSEDTHLPQGNEDVNIPDFVQDTSSGMVGMSTVDFLPCSTDVQEKLPKVDLVPQPEDAHLPEYVIIADFVQDGSSAKLPKVDMVPQPEDTHLPQGDEGVNIEDFVQDSSSGMSRVRSSIDFLPCSTDVQEKFPKVDMAPQPEDAHLPQGDEDVNIADFAVEGSSGSLPEKMSCSTDLQDKLPRVDMALQPDDAHLPQGDEDVNIADFVVEGSSGSPPEKLSCSTDLQDKLPRVDMALQLSEDTHLPQGNEDVNIADFVQDTSSGIVEISTVDFLPCSTDVQEKLPKVDLAPQPEDAHLPEYVIITDFVQDGSSGMSTETSSIDFLPCSTELLDKLPKVDMVPQTEDTHLPQGDEGVNIEDFVQDSSSRMSRVRSSIDFLPCSTDVQEKLPKVDMAPQPEDAHLPQGDEDVNIADFVVEGSSGSPPEKLSCSTDLQDKLPRVDMALQLSEDTHLPQGNEDVNIADFVQDTSSGIVEISTVNFLPCSTDVHQPEDAHLPEYVIITDFVQDGSSGMSTETSSIDFLPCSTELLDKLPKVDMVPQPEDTHLPQGDEGVNIEDFVQDSSSRMSRVRSSIDFLPCSTDVQEKLPKVDMAPQPEDAHLPQGDEDVNIADFVVEGSSGSPPEKLSCSTELQDKLPRVDMALQPSEDTHLPQGNEDVNIADFVQDTSSGIVGMSTVDFLPCSTDVQEKLPKVDLAPQPEDAQLPDYVIIADFVQDSSSGMSTETSSIDFLPCSTELLDKLPKVDMVPQPEDTHLPQGDEDVNIADFVQDSSSGMSSIDFLPCSTDVQEKLPKVDMAPQPEDAHLPQGDEDVNIADFVVEGSSGISPEKLSCSTDLQDKLPKVDMALEPSEDTHPSQDEKDINIADFVQDSSSGMSTETSSIDFLPCSTELLDKLPKVDMVPQPEDTHLPQGDEDVNIADFVQDSSSGMSSIDFLPCSTDVQEKLPKVDMAPQPEDAHLPQGDEDVNIADFVVEGSSGISPEKLSCSTDLQDKLPKVDMALEPSEDTHPSQDEKDINIADFVQDSSSGMSTETSSIYFLPCSTELLDKLPKVDMVPQPEDTHLPQGDEDVDIANFVQDSSSGMSSKNSSIDFLLCSTDVREKLRKVDKAEDGHLPEDINIADFVQDSSSGMSTETSSIGPCSTELLDKVPKVPQPEDTHLPQGDEYVNIADFVQDSSSGMSREKSSIDFLPCSTDVQEELPKVDTAPQPEDARLPQGDDDANIADFVQDSSSGMSTETSSIGPCSTELLDKLPKVDMVPQPEDTQGDEDVNIADFVQDSSSGMSREKSSIDFLPCSTDVQEELPKVDTAPQPEDARLPQCDDDANIADYVQDSSSGMSTETSSIGPCSTELLDKLPKVDVVPQPEDTNLPQGDEDVNIADFVQDSSSGMSREKSSIDFLPCSMDVQEKLPKVDMASELTARLVVISDHSFKAGREQDIIETPQGDNLNFGIEQLNHPTLRAVKENEKKSNLSESVHGETSPGSVYSSSIFLFLLPCFLLILAILLFFFRNSRKLLGLILWLILSILLCPYKVLRLTWRYFCSLSRRRRHVTGGTKPVSKKHDHSLTHDATAATQHSPDITVLETSGLKGESCSRSRIEHKENRGIGLLYSASLNACFTRYLPPPPQSNVIRKMVRSVVSCHVFNAVNTLFSVSLIEALFSCTSMCLVLSFFNLIFVMMMKPLEVLSNHIWAVWARAAAVCLILTKPKKIISNTIKAFWGCLKRPVHTTEASTSKGSQQRKGETLISNIVS